MLFEQSIKCFLPSTEVAGRITDPDKLDGFNLVSLLDLLDYGEVLDDTPEYRMHVVQAGCRLVGDEKLTAVAIGTGIFHRHAAGAVVAQLRMEFIGKSVPGFSDPDP